MYFHYIRQLVTLGTTYLHFWKGIELSFFNTWKKKGMGGSVSSKIRHVYVHTAFSLTPYLESFTPTFGLGTPVFPRISSNLHCGTPTFSKRCLWDSYFQNPSENPGHIRN